MKLFESHSDRKAEIHFLCDEAVTSIYEDPEIPDSNTWVVPVQTNKPIGVKVRFRGTFRAIHVDLVVDGMLRHSENSIKHSPAKDRRNYDFTTGFLTNSSGIPIEGVLWPTAKDYSCVTKAKGGNLGSLEIIVSISATDEDQWHALSVPSSFGPMPVGQNYDGLVPKHEIGLAELNSPQPSSATLARLRKRAISLRPGAQVWRTVKFLYRAADDIRDAGFVARQHVVRWFQLPLLIAPSPEILRTLGVTNDNGGNIGTASSTLVAAVEGFEEAVVSGKSITSPRRVSSAVNQREECTVEQLRQNTMKDENQNETAIETGTQLIPFPSLATAQTAVAPLPSTSEGNSGSEITAEPNPSSSFLSIENGIVQPIVNPVPASGSRLSPIASLPAADSSDIQHGPFPVSTPAANSRPLTALPRCESALLPAGHIPVSTTDPSPIGTTTEPGRADIHRGDTPSPVPTSENRKRATSASVDSEPKRVKVEKRDEPISNWLQVLREKRTLRKETERCRDELKSQLALKINQNMLKARISDEERLQREAAVELEEIEADLAIFEEN